MECTSCYVTLACGVSVTITKKEFDKLLDRLIAEGNLIFAKTKEFSNYSYTVYSTIDEHIGTVFYDK